MQNQLSIDSFKTPLGYLAYALSERGLVRTTFMYDSKEASLVALLDFLEGEYELLGEQEAEKWRFVLSAYLEGKTDLELHIDDEQWSPFFKKVYYCVKNIPAGEVRSYAEVARMVGSPGAARAVGTAMKKNPIAPIVPCHRVVSSSGAIGGFSAVGGVGLKEKMLAGERGE